MRKRSVLWGARRRWGSACLLRVIAFLAFLWLWPSSMCSFWRPERICSDLHSWYLEVHIRLFCKNSPEHTSEIKAQRKRGIGSLCDLGRLGRMWERMLPSRESETAVLRSAFDLRTSHIFGADPEAAAHTCWAAGTQCPEFKL